MSSVDNTKGIEGADVLNIHQLEIRNYLLKPNTRDHFIDYFEAHFIDSQQNANMYVLGQFRVIDAPDHFIWLRGFSDMRVRLEALKTFYYGPVWEKYGQLANSMMIDSDNVHLLHPLGNVENMTYGLTVESIARDFESGTLSPQTGLIVIDFYHALPDQRDSLIHQFQTEVIPAYQQQAIQLRGTFIAEMSENTFPRLPVIQNNDEFVVITAYESEVDYREKQKMLEPGIQETLGLWDTR